MDYCLQIENLSKNYNSFKLNNVNINIPSGSIMGFIGENGAGKTTTIKLILNLIKRDSGKIKILGLDNIKDEKAIKEQIGVVFDESYFHDMLDVNQVEKILKNVYKNWDTHVYGNYIEKFKLPNDKIIKEFSRGMKMKLSIASALSHNPKLLILDEATSGLDPIVRNEILDIFYDFIQDESHSILISSHITSDLEKIADYITFIHNGEILLSSTKDDFLENYSIIKCSLADYEAFDKSDIIGVRKNSFGYELLVHLKSNDRHKYESFIKDRVSLEDILLFYVKEGK